MAWVRAVVRCTIHGFRILRLNGRGMTPVPLGPSGGLGSSPYDLDSYGDRLYVDVSEKPGKWQEWHWRASTTQKPNGSCGVLGIALRPDTGLPPEIEFPANLRERLDDLRSQASLLPQAEAADLVARATALSGSLASAQFQTAVAGIEALENDVALASKRASAEEAQAQSGDRVSLVRLQREWRAAQQEARERLQGFVATLLSDMDLQQDERYPSLEAAAHKLTALIPDDRGSLAEALAAVDDASDPAVARAARGRALRALQAYSAALDGDENLPALQDLADDAFDGAPFFSGLKRSLASLGAQLETRV